MAVPNSATCLDAGPQWAVGKKRVQSANMSGAAADITDAPDTGKKIILTDLVVSVSTAMMVNIKEETTGTVFLTFYMAANSTMQFTPRSPLKLDTANKKLQAQTDVAGNISITTFWYSEA